MTRGQALQMTGWEARSHAVRILFPRRPSTLRTPSEHDSHAVRAHSGRRPDSIRTPSEAGSDGVIQGAGRRGDQWIQAPGLKLYTLTSPGLNHAGTVPELPGQSPNCLAIYRKLPGNITRLARQLQMRGQSPQGRD